MPSVQGNFIFRLLINCNPNVLDNYMYMYNVHVHVIWSLIININYLIFHILCRMYMCTCMLYTYMYIVHVHLCRCSFFLIIVKLKNLQWLNDYFFQLNWSHLISDYSLWYMVVHAHGYIVHVHVVFIQCINIITDWPSWFAVHTYMYMYACSIHVISGRIRMTACGYGYGYITVSSYMYTCTLYSTNSHSCSQKCLIRTRPEKLGPYTHD